MGSGRVWWRREALGLAGRVSGPALRRRSLLRPLRGPVAVLAGVPLLSLGLVAGVSLAMIATSPARARAEAAGPHPAENGTW
jgi:hypothetical protein